MITKVENAVLRCLGDMPVEDPKYGDMKLNVFPIKHPCRRVLMPNEFKLWETQVNAMLRFVPPMDSAPDHYVTIDSKFFAVEETLRREGIHVDGNFCVDPKFSGATWGGTTTTTWGGSKYCPELIAVTPWVSPYNVYPPVGDYVTGEKGGILCASSYSGCHAWSGTFNAPVESEGAYDHAASELGEPEVLDRHKLYFMTSNTPHETLAIPKGERRTLIRITLDHRYDSRLILDS